MEGHHGILEVCVSEPHGDGVVVSRSGWVDLPIVVHHVVTGLIQLPKVLQRIHIIGYCTYIQVPVHNTIICLGEVHCTWPVQLTIM